MIAANELRIGNIFYSQTMTREGAVIPETSITWKVAEVGIFSIKACSSSTPYAKVEKYTEFVMGVVSPIPLSPDILVKCGFDKTEVTTKDIWMPNGYTEIYYSLDSGDLFALTLKMHNSDDGFYFRSKDAFLSIFYLHQLQNLYFSLTGKELTYTP